MSSSHAILALTLAASVGCAEQGELANEDDYKADIAAVVNVCEDFPKEDKGADLQQMYPEDNESVRDQRYLCQSGGYRSGLLSFPLPSRGYFDMCFGPPTSIGAAAGYGVDLNKAKWLAFLAGNQYSHYAHIAPVLERMGFGDAGEGQDWVHNSANTIELRGRDQRLEGVPDEELRPSDLDLQGNRIVFAPGWEKALVQDIVPGKKIQFFSAGALGMVEGDDGAEREEFIDKSTQFFWAEHRTKNAVIISFRGTEASKTEDLATDIDLFKTDYSTGGIRYGSVHSGFLDAHLDVENMLRQKLAAESGQGLTIWVTGHSLGAAMGTMATTTIMDIIDYEIASGMPEENRYKLAGVYTWGSPRVGDEDFVTAIESQYAAKGVSAMRFRHGNDVVTRYPKFLYEHVGKLMHYTNDAITEDIEGGELVLEFDFKPADPDPGTSNWLFWKSAADHSMTNYYSRSISALEHYSELGEVCD